MTTCHTVFSCKNVNLEPLCFFQFAFELRETSHICEIWYAKFIYGLSVIQYY